MTLSSADRRAVSGLVGDVAKLQREVKLLASRKPGLAQSSIENGSVDEYTADGTLASVIGKQHDGTHTATSVTGPKPATPWFPTAMAVPGLAEMRWNGKFAGGVPSPMDLKHVAAYAVPVGGVVDLSKQSGVMTGELGDSVQVQLDAGVYDVYLAAWSLSGKVSDLAGPVSVVVPIPADGAALQEEIDAAKARIDGVRNDLATAGAELTGRLDDAEFELSDMADDVAVAGTTAAVENLYVTNTGTMAEAVINRLFADVVMSRKLAASQVNVGDFTNYATIDPVRRVNVTVPANWATVTAGAYTRKAPASANYIMFKDQTDTVPFKAGETLRVEFDAIADTGPATVALRLWTYNTPVGTLPQQNGPTFTGPTFAIAATEGHFSAELPITSALSAEAKAWIMGLYGSGIPQVGVRNVRVTRMMGGEVIVDGAITAPKITASEELSAKVASFLKVYAEQLDANAIDGMVITGAIFQSPGDGAGFQLTENGYTSRDADGNVTVRLPADGSPAQFRGDIEARSLTATGQVSFQAPTNEVASGAALVLASGVAAPATPPTVGTGYTSVRFPAPPEPGSVSGIAYADGLWWRAVDVGGATAGDRIEGINAAGAIVRSWPVAFWTRNGITAIGNELFLLGSKDGQSDIRHIRVYNVVTGAFVREWQYLSFGGGTYQPGIGTDGTNIIVAQCWATGLLTWRYYNPVTGAQTGQVDTATKVAADSAGIFQGVADFGATRVAVTRSDGVTNVFTTAGTAVAFGGWRSAKGAGVVGLAYQGGKFRHLTKQGDLVSYSGFQDSAGDTSDWWVAQSWVGATGEETMAGPAQGFQFMRRSELQFTAAQVPPGAVSARFYLARKATVPGRADLHLIGAGTKSVRVAMLPSNWTTLAIPPASNTFANSTPGLIKSTIGKFEAKGDGSGKWGPLTFNADGSMSSSAVPAWVPITTFKSGFGPQTFGYVPAYRVWPDGKVEWRGIVAGAIPDLATTSVFTLPPGTIPAEIGEFVTAATWSSSAKGAVRLEMRTEADPSLVTVRSLGGVLGWFSLDGVYYYLS